MNRRNKIILIAVIVALIALMALFPAIKRALFNPIPDNTSAYLNPRKNVLNVNAMILGYEDLDERSIVVGMLMPDEEVDLSFETSGKITGIYFKEGTHVKKGELLAKVNDSPLQAELRKLDAQLPLAQDRVFRQQSLLEKDAVSRESYESVFTDLETLKADIDLVKSKIAQTELRAPFDGMVGLRKISEGTYASPSTIVSGLTRISPIKIEFSINEKQLSEIKPGKKINFSVDSDREFYEATVYAVESQLDRATFSLKAKALHPNAEGRLKPGQSAKVDINLQDLDNSIVIPSISILAEMGRDIVFVYKNGTAQQVEIKKGMRTATSVRITEGLQFGDTLITTGVMQLRDGMSVSLNNITDAGSL